VSPTGRLRVAVFMGGVSREREISISGGRRIVEALVNFQVVPVEILESGAWKVDGQLFENVGAAIDVVRARADVAYLCLHGRQGEDGAMQGLLEVVNLPYTGSGVLGSALALDKVQTKVIFTAYGLPTPLYRVIRPGQPVPNWGALTSELGSTVVVKLAHEGSSFGVRIVRDASSFAQAVAGLRSEAPSDTLLLEAYVAGRELTCAVLEGFGQNGPFALPVTEIVPDPKSSFFDFQAKYTSKETQEVTPARIDDAIRDEVQRLAVSAHRVLGCRDLSRTDFMLRPSGALEILETNTLPGMTAKSLLPQAAAVWGLDFAGLVRGLVENAAARGVLIEEPETYDPEDLAEDADSSRNPSIQPIAELAPELAGFLGERACEVVDSLPDASLQSRVVQALESCRRSLQVIDSLDLAPHELAELGTLDLSVWNALAPDARRVLMAVHQTVNQLAELFPLPEGLDDDIAVDEIDVDDMFGVAEAAPKLGVWSQDIDGLVASVSDDADSELELARTVATLRDMLKRDLTDFGGALRNPSVVGDRWSILAELQEFRSKCEQCVEAIVAAVLTAYSLDNIEEVLPRYLSTTMRLVRLRSAIVDLSHDLNQFNDAIQQGSREEAAILVDALRARLDAFAQEAAYRHIRPHDKKIVILLRIHLKGWSIDHDLDSLRRQLDDATKCIELMQGISKREQLAVHDQEVLEEVEGLVVGGGHPEQVMKKLSLAYGSSVSVSRLVRSFREGRVPSREEILAIVRGAAVGSV
jgi:D-alanine-D-alanine ligase